MVPERAARYALFMLTIAYVFNFIDRQILGVECRLGCRYMPVARA
jgi:hypothetical protein